MNPGRRLLSAASLCRGGDIIDIGSDHGFLPAWLLLNAKCVSASASDINPMPLERCRKTAEKYGVAEKMRFFLSDGFDSVEGDYDAAFVCGMGGIMIADIIRRAPGRAALWVLQPMTTAEILRAFLWDNGYVITEEVYTVEKRKPYAVIAAEYTGIAAPYSYADTYLGKSRPQSAEYVQYVRKTLASALKRLMGKKRENADTSCEEQLIEECVRHIS